MTVGSAFTSELNQIASISSPGSSPGSSVNENDVSSYLGASVSGILGFVGGSQETFTSLCAEVYQNKYVILGSGGIALLVSFVFTQLLRFFAKTLCVICLALTWALLGICTAVLAYKAGIINTTSLPQVFQSINPVAGGASVDNIL